MQKLALIILDGFGMAKEDKYNAIYLANMPFFKRVWQQYPHTLLQASGEYVGLPQGQIGGSEVGHLTIGAGRVLYQDLVRVDKGFTEPHGQFGVLKNPEFLQFLADAKTNTAHLIGLVSAGGIHSYDTHLHYILTLMKAHNCKEPIIHFISDGRDTPPTSGRESMKKLLTHLDALQFGKVATVSGRFYAMDRDKNYDRIHKATDLLLSSRSDSTLTIETWNENSVKIFDKMYETGITDEFIVPTLVDKEYNGIEPGSPLFFCNFRSDRMKQIVSDMHEKLPESRIFTMTQYDKTYTFAHVIFDKLVVTNTLGEIISNNGLKQLRSAETDKIPHVSYFFNGGVEVTFPGEIRAFIQSNRVVHYTMPEMKAKEITDAVISETIKEDPAFILVNFANTDLVGHSGIIPPTVVAAETVDKEMERMCDFLTKNGYIVLITADHGNADIMFDPVTQQPVTSHTMSPVPFIVYDPQKYLSKDVKLDQNETNGLSKVAGTVLDLMGIAKPAQDFESLLIV